MKALEEQDNMIGGGRGYYEYHTPDELMKCLF